MGVGPLIGGALTETIGWRSIFWINVPIGIAAALLTARFVPESKALRARAFDPVGQALVLTGLATLTFAVIEGPHQGSLFPKHCFENSPGILETPPVIHTCDAKYL